MDRSGRLIRIKEAAEFLGVSQNTLRNWGRAGKIAEHRDPANGYRLYRRGDLDALLQEIERSASPPHEERG